MEKFDCIIIGGGPAGLFCGANIRSFTKDGLLLLEKNQSPGRKLLISGSGRCNITHTGNLREVLSHFHDQSAFLKPSLQFFSNKHLLEFFHEKKLPTLEMENGKIFPESMKAEDVLDVLFSACGKNGCQIRCSEAVENISIINGTFRVESSLSVYQAQYIVVCTGGQSYPSTGSTGEGYRFLRELGHPVTDTSPALTPFFIRNYPFSELAGISVNSPLCALIRDGKVVSRGGGDVLFTHRGLSGPAVLDISGDARNGDVFRFALTPLKAEFLESDFISRSRSDGAKSIKSFMKIYDIAERTIVTILEYSGIAPEKHVSEISRTERQKLLQNICSLELEIGEKGGFNMAMATKGGASLQDMNPRTMESLCVPGLYIAGEVLDVVGDTGGYNLQAAFSTARLAAESISRKLAGR
jgi:predicted Rossmann fold flavoprotein